MNILNRIPTSRKRHTSSQKHSISSEAYRATLAQDGEWRFREWQAHSLSKTSKRISRRDGSAT